MIREEMDNVTEEERVQFEIRCRFNSFCKKVIRNKASDLRKALSRRFDHEVFMEDLSALMQGKFQAPSDELCGEVFYFVGGRGVSDELLHDAIDSLPDKKQTVINMYFFDNMKDYEIANALGLSRTGAAYRRRSSLEVIKRYLEAHRDD